MSLSKELQQSKAAEHLVCADLILQGYNAFLADAGLPYDVVVEVDGSLLRIQVKSTMKLTHITRSGVNYNRPVYRYGIRRQKFGRTTYSLDDCDWFAFVALDKRIIAYIHASRVIKGGRAGIDIKTRSFDYQPGRVYRNGKTRAAYGSLYMEDYCTFGMQVLNEI
jgi:uncharacterized protein (DUF1015 family)